MTHTPLKQQNLPALRVFIAANVGTFFLLVFHEHTALVSPELFFREALAAAGPTALLTILTIVLNGVLPAGAKETLVFFRFRDRLPGSRFTRLIANDPRIDRVLLEKHFGSFPEDSSQQNTFWYKLYKQHERRPSVLDAHKSYLLTRDMTGLASLFLILFGPGVYITGQPTITLIYYLLALAAQFVTLSHVARTYANRFVLNVLAEEGARAQQSCSSSGRPDGE